jgi:uncharacterized protein YecE (DUF72 family)
MARLLVGLPALQGDLEKYQERFDLVEIRPVDTPLPRPATLRRWRKAVPPGFVFSVVLPQAVGELAPGKALDDALAASLEAAATVEARCVVLRTPASVRPTSANKRRLAALFERIPPEGTIRCWEPAGIWEREEVAAVARDVGALPVLDAARDPIPPGPIAYTRLRALGKSSTMSAASLERVAERLRRRREAYVIVEGGAAEALRVKAALTGALSKKRERPGSAMIVRPGMPSPLVAEDEEQ